MKKMNGRVLHLEEGVPEEECGHGWMRSMLVALRKWERLNGVPAGGFAGMNKVFFKKRKRTKICQND